MIEVENLQKCFWVRQHRRGLGGAWRNLVTVAGLVPWRQRRVLARRIGVVFGQRTQLWWDLPLIESLDLLRYIYRVPAARFAANLSVFRKVLELEVSLIPRCGN